jgi:hypothetical protein
VLIWGGSIAVLSALFLTDPDQGLSTGMLLLALVTPLLAVAFSHWGRKGLFDYPAADMEQLFKRAGEGSTGSGLALIAIALVISALLGLFGRSAQAAVPAQAHQYLPTLSAEVKAHWPDHPMPHYFGGLIEHESCITLTHSRCWRPTSQLKTQREEGAGLGQLTRAYRPDGALRFDALAEVRARHPALRELDWSNVYQRPDLQMRAIVLKSRDDWRALGRLPLPFVDLAYNAGRGRVTQDRRACQVTAGCDPSQWFGHVERTCTASRAVIYGKRSACDISRHHVKDVLIVRAPKYAGLV